MIPSTHRVKLPGNAATAVVFIISYNHRHCHINIDSTSIKNSKNRIKKIVTMYKIVTVTP